jgi:predicted MPP superfamily phosphohydrolase
VLAHEKRIVAAAGSLVTAAVGGLAWWALWHEPRDVRVRHRTINPPRWPRALDGLTVGVVSDLHTGAPHVDLDRVRGIVADLNAERPDLVALLGDYADSKPAAGTRYAAVDVAAALGELRAPLGRFAVLGNHDWAAHGRAMPRALRAAGITVLENTATPVDGAGAPLWIAGLADATTRNPRLDDALEVVPADQPVLLLTHDPDLFPHVPDGVALTLAGHTHGAQVDLPVVRDRTTPSQHGARYTKGHQVEGGRHLFVSPGVGTSRFPIRFRARPEVTLLRLKAPGA